jgi:hypothetical protein
VGAYPLRYVEDCFGGSKKMRSNYRTTQQEIISHHPVRYSTPIAPHMFPNLNPLAGAIEKLEKVKIIDRYLFPH